MSIKYVPYNKEIPLLMAATAWHQTRIYDYSSVVDDVISHLPEYCVHHDSYNAYFYCPIRYQIYEIWNSGSSPGSRGAIWNVTAEAAEDLILQLQQSSFTTTYHLGEKSASWESAMPSKINIALLNRLRYDWREELYKSLIPYCGNVFKKDGKFYKIVEASEDEYNTEYAYHILKL